MYSYLVLGHGEHGHMYSNLVLGHGESMGLCIVTLC